MCVQWISLDAVQNPRFQVQSAAQRSYRPPAKHYGFANCSEAWHQRFDAKWAYDIASECWVWHGAKTRLGYGRYVRDGKGVFAHRLAFLREFGCIPDDSPLDHLCHNPSCINPYHLEPTTHAENLRRALVYRYVPKKDNTGKCSMQEKQGSFPASFREFAQMRAAGKI